MMYHRSSLPETYVSPDGAEFSVRLARPEDYDAFRAFFESLPARDRLWFQEDLAATGARERWANAIESGRATIFVALDKDRIVGQVGIFRRLHGWTRHVGYMQTIVHPNYRGRGIATILSRRSVELAVQLGVDKIVAEVLTDQRRERRILETHGFKKEAILQDHATDHEGRKRNVIILSNHVYEIWRRMEDLVLDRDFEVIP